MNVRDVRPSVPPLVTPSATRAPRRVENPAAESPRDAVAPSDVLSGAEKDFFANAFPSSSDLRTPAAYRKDGAVSQTGLGRMIDRKG